MKRPLLDGIEQKHRPQDDLNGRDPDTGYCFAYQARIVRRVEGTIEIQQLANCI
ncbi:MAG: hypothetical protein ACREDL_03205 [Bradyrhizobium sp.]